MFKVGVCFSLTCSCQRTIACEAISRTAAECRLFKQEAFTPQVYSLEEGKPVKSTQLSHVTY